MRVAFVLSTDFNSPGAKQVYHFANGIARLGHAAMVLLVGDPASVAIMANEPQFKTVPIHLHKGRLAPEVLQQVHQFQPDLVHAWTPRNVPARVGLELKEQLPCKLLVDFEDNEELHFRRALAAIGQRYPIPDRLQWLLRPVQYLRMLHRLAMDPLAWEATQPFHSRRVCRAADGFTAICEPLKRYLERRFPDKPVYLLYPGADLARFNPSVDGQPVRAELGLLGRRIVMYTGVLTPKLFQPVLEALRQTVARHPEVVFVHIGIIEAQSAVSAQIGSCGLQDHVFHVGSVNHSDMHRYMAAADVLLQYAWSEPEVDEYRLPAKVPEYLAMGKPVLIFHNGIGRVLQDGQQVLKHDGTAADMAAKILAVLENPLLAKRLGYGARRVAEQLFDWDRNAQTLLEIYQDCLAVR